MVSTFVAFILSAASIIFAAIVTFAFKDLDWLVISIFPSLRQAAAHRLWLATVDRVIAWQPLNTEEECLAGEQKSIGDASDVFMAAEKGQDLNRWKRAYRTRKAAKAFRDTFEAVITRDKVRMMNKCLKRPNSQESTTTADHGQVRQSNWIANPGKTLESPAVRTSLLPGLLETVHENHWHALPFRIFEAADVVLKDTSWASRTPCLTGGSAGLQAIATAECDRGHTTCLWRC
ncbi:hypothetical protein FA95DRAFT_1574999 [Auriscalpium vulgare]|uniref:Uncharacterized protein n=1 Tax=Auriscalpium vulgare TaxID=40419 RepID=A0ACB8RI58_9AGAM|nr:hypothetical protein FA95DRAFT_1574999 [Auriscalpium vulgare]